MSSCPTAGRYIKRHGIHVLVALILSNMFHEFVTPCQPGRPCFCQAFELGPRVVLDVLLEVLHANHGQASLLSFAI